MITIELDSCGGVATRFPEAQTISALNRLLDRCDAENMRDLVLRFPSIAPKNLEEALRPVLERPFRFLAWFRAAPPLTLAELFISKGHRITLASTAAPGGSALQTLLANPVCTADNAWEVSFFIALPAPVPGLLDGPNTVFPRAGTNITLAVGWANPDSGPAPMSRLEEKAWVETLPQMLRARTDKGITVQFACGLPLCMFSTEQLGDLALSRIRHPLATCAPSLVLTLDGRARVCPHLPAGGWVSVPASVTLKELEGQLTSAASFFAPFCGRPAEQACRSFATGACGGGCMALNAAMWRGNQGGLAEGHPGASHVTAA